MDFEEFEFERKKDSRKISYKMYRNARNESNDI